MKTSSERLKKILEILFAANKNIIIAVIFLKVDTKTSVSCEVLTGPKVDKE